MTGHLRRKHAWRSWLAGLVAALLLLAPIILALAAPRLASLPARAPAASLPPMPTPATDALPTLEGLIDPLPLVVRDLPDESSRLAGNDYGAASLLDPADAATMFDHAWQGLVFDSELADDLLLYGEYLLFDGGYLIPEQAAVTEPSAEAAAAMAALSGDPRNADRLNNLAVALFALGTANQSAPPLTTLYEAELTSAEILQYHAVELLAAVDRAFARNRAVQLNLAYFVSVVPSPTGALPAAIGVAERVLAADPEDRTAQHFLGSLQSRRLDVADGLDRARSVLQPLLIDPATAPLGRAALGDAYLAAALVRPEAPFLAKDLARRALDEYDRALAATTDPGVYAGRAAALEVLDAVPEALAAQQRASALAPASVDLRLGLARLQEANGDFVAMRETVDEALALVGDDWDPRLASLRYVVAPSSPESGFVVAGDRGYLGYSFGSDRDHASVSRNPEGGAFVISLDLIPRTNAPNLDDWLRTGFAPDVAAFLATAAAILTVDEFAAGSLADPAVLLVAGEPLPPDADSVAALHTAETALRGAEQFATAAEVCRRALRAPTTAGFDRIAALQCAGESAYLAGDFAPAAADLAAAHEAASDPIDSAGAAIDTLRLRAGVAAEAAGQRERARELYTLVVADSGSNPGTRAAAAGKLGELALDAGDPAAAVGWYDLVLTMIEGANDPFWSSTATELLLARTTTKRAYNNRGVARLRLAQTDPAAAPDCSGPGRPLCAAARADFAAALAVDPLDPVTLLNAGWVARARGDRAQARADLALAATVDPTLFPALNDLGVLAAEAGDAAAARRAFVAALAVAPDYDLAAWNLGVLELQRGLAGILPGQAWLQRALSRNPALRGHDLAFTSDERVYRVTFGPGARIERGWSFGSASSLAGAALGAIAAVATLAMSLRSLLLEEFASVVTEQGVSRLARGGTYLRTGLRRWLPRPLWHRWRVWEPWLLTVPVLVVVTAWPVWHANPAIGPAAVAMALFAAAVAIAAHELGHAVVARALGASVTSAQWVPGVGLALLLLPLNLSSGPFVGQRITGADAERAWWVALAGPAANFIVAGAAFAVFLALPLPLLRLVVAAQLAAIGYALLPFAPLDGSELKRRPLLVTAFGVLVAVAGVLYAQGLG